jgi:hypothetical protein
VNILIFKRTHETGNPYIAGHRYVSTYALKLHWFAIKLTFTEYNKGYGFCTWYPFAFYWAVPSTKLRLWRTRWRILGLHIHKRPTPGVIG